MDKPTVEIYEAESARYEALRAPRFLREARRFGTLVKGGPVADLGCGPGWYTAAVGRPAIAFDAALSMLRRTGEVAPSAWLVQGDLQALPFRRGALRGAWARNSYVHLAAGDVPMALADLHRATRAGAPIELTFFGGDRHGQHLEGRDVFPDDDMPGRWFSTWSAERLADVMIGSGFAIDALAERRDGHGNLGFTLRARRDRTLPDTVAAGMRLLVCGLNPSLRAADAGVGFVTPGNRFWPAALEAGLVSRDRDPRHALLVHGVGMTDLVKRATARAAELTREEYEAGVERLDRLCAWLRPRAVCVVGLAGWRAVVNRTAAPGWQIRTLGDQPVYVMPSTSGLNAATSLSTLVEHLRAAVSGT
ncbi:MAG: uracil-DNA glycosylase family protein [Actinomycetota bacterium]